MGGNEKFKKQVKSERDLGFSGEAEQVKPPAHSKMAPFFYDVCLNQIFLFPGYHRAPEEWNEYELFLFELCPVKPV